MKLLMKYFLSITIAFFTLFNTANAALTDADRAEFVHKNLLADRNPGFESGRGGWTASGGTFATVTSGSNLLVGKVSATWNSNGAGQTLTSTAVTIPNGLYSQNGLAFCRILTPSGTATHTISVFDGTNTLVSATVISSTLPLNNPINFVFPSTGSVSIRITSVAADEPLIAIDDCYLGLATNLTNVVPENVFSAFVSSTDVVSNENLNWIDGNCTNASSGKATCNFVSGIFNAAPNCVTTASVSTSTANSCHVESISSTSVTVECNSTTETNRDFQLLCQKSEQNASVPAFRPDQVANSWSGYHDSDCSWTRTSTTFDNPAADATCTFAELNNSNFGTVSSYVVTNNMPGITFTPSRAGRYFVCAQFELSSGTGGAYPAARLADLAGNELSTVRMRMPLSGGDAANLCGILNATSTASQTARILLASNSTNNAVINSSPFTGQRAISWQIFQIDYSLPAPILVGSVTSRSSTPERIERASVDNTAGTWTITSQSGWLSGFVDVAQGEIDLTVIAGVFASTPTCTCSVRSNSNMRTCMVKTGISSTTIPLSVVNSSGTSQDGTPIEVICMGPKGSL